MDKKEILSLLLPNDQFLIWFTMFNLSETIVIKDQILFFSHQHKQLEISHASNLKHSLAIDCSCHINQPKRKSSSRWSCYWSSRLHQSNSLLWLSQNYQWFKTDSLHLYIRLVECNCETFDILVQWRTGMFILDWTYSRNRPLFGW